MSRFRLRFLLQEFDLPIGEVVLGRSPECHVTIEDPLISRQHARIVVTPTQCTFVDLGSRNGSRVNGRHVTAPTPLVDADRIRLGAQELVFFEMGSSRRAPRATGAMTVCNSCGTPYPEGPATCPHCGANASNMARDPNDETMSGLVLEPRRTWMLQLMGEVLEKALSSQRFGEAERILQRAVDELNDRLSVRESVEPTQVGQLAEYALRLAVLKGDARWVRWVTDTLKVVDVLPSALLLDRFADARALPGVSAMVGDLITHWRAQSASFSGEQKASFQRLEEFARGVGEA